MNMVDHRLLGLRDCGVLRAPVADPGLRELKRRNWASAWWCGVTDVRLGPLAHWQLTASGRNEAERVARNTVRGRLTETDHGR